MNIITKIFRTESEYGNFIDPRDGHTYKTIQIGKHVWMAENLSAETFRNSDLIINITENEKWKQQNTAAWCYYNNDEKLGAVYGKLYNYRAIQDRRGLAPPGWHIPTSDEYNRLIWDLGGPKIAGGKMKIRGNEYWNDPNLCSKKISGFNALPGGFRFDYGKFEGIGTDTYFWTTSKDKPATREIDYTPEQLYQLTGHYTWEDA